MNKLSSTMGGGVPLINGDESKKRAMLRHGQKLGLASQLLGNLTSRGIPWDQDGEIVPAAEVVQYALDLADAFDAAASVIPEDCQ